MENTGKIFLNLEGMYLVFNEVPAHSPNTNYTFSWTNNLNYASVCASINTLKNLQWRTKSPVKDVVIAISAKVIRKVEITESIDK